MRSNESLVGAPLSSGQEWEIDWHFSLLHSCYRGLSERIRTSRWPLCRHVKGSSCALCRCGNSPFVFKKRKNEKGGGMQGNYQFNFYRYERLVRLVHNKIPFCSMLQEWNKKNITGNPIRPVKERRKKVDEMKFFESLSHLTPAIIAGHKGTVRNTGW